MNTRLRRGATSPEKPGLVFLRYADGAERWVTPERLARERKQKQVADAKWSAKPEAKEYRRKYSLRQYHEKESRRQYQAERSKTPEVRARMKAYYEANKDQIAEQRRLYNQRPEVRAARLKRDQAPERKAKVQASVKKWRQTKGRLAHNLRSRIYSALRAQGYTKKAKANELFGCDFPTFKLHLQLQFRPGMCWENFGAWEIDHIRPVASFDLSDPDQQKACFHFSNCQPLWKEENRAKSDKIIPFPVAA